MHKHTKKNKNKLKILLEYWYTKRYLEALINNPPPPKIESDNGETTTPEIERIQNSWYQFEHIRKNYLGTIEEVKNLGIAPVVLYNMPREFERWRDFYEQHDKNIAHISEDLDKPP